jgi:hypothetical protein
MAKKRLSFDSPFVVNVNTEEVLCKCNGKALKYCSSFPNNDYEEGFDCDHCSQSVARPPLYHCRGCGSDCCPVCVVKLVGNALSIPADSVERQLLGSQRPLLTSTRQPPKCIVTQFALPVDEEEIERGVVVSYHLDGYFGVLLRDRTAVQIASDPIVSQSKPYAVMKHCGVTPQHGRTMAVSIAPTAKRPVVAPVSPSRVTAAEIEKLYPWLPAHFRKMRDTSYLVATAAGDDKAVHSHAEMSPYPTFVCACEKFRKPAERGGGWIIVMYLSGAHLQLEEPSNGLYWSSAVGNQRKEVALSVTFTEALRDQAARLLVS